MPDNLARFERLAQQTRMRAAQRRDSRLTTSEQDAKDDADRIIQERDRRLKLEAAGPPNACDVCYRIDRVFPWTPGCIAWQHFGAVNPQMRPWALWEDGEEELIEHCMHECHDPEGLPLPVIVYA